MVKRIKFLKTVIKNHPLLSSELEFSLVADQKVFKTNNEELTHLFSNIWLNNITTITGRNASGKTTIMKLVSGILSFLVSGNSICETKLNESLIGDNKIIFETYFYGSDNLLYKDCVSFKKTNNKWIVLSEKIYQKKASSTMSKKALYDFNESDLLFDRSEIDKLASAVLAKDDSLFKAVLVEGEYMPFIVADTLVFTDMNLPITFDEEVPKYILEYLDSSIEYLKLEHTNENSVIYHLKFKGIDKEITNNNFATIQFYLSSGTSKGITLYAMILTTLKHGGILFIDEIENHFNQVIVDTFLDYFKDPEINNNNANVVFTTHYAEILDKIDRGDQIYIASREDRIELNRYSQLKIRMDLSKAEVFKSSILKGTAPEYEALMKLNKATIKVLSNE